MLNILCPIIFISSLHIGSGPDTLLGRGNFYIPKAHSPLLPERQTVFFVIHCAAPNPEPDH